MTYVLNSSSILTSQIAPLKTSHLDLQFRVCSVSAQWKILLNLIKLRVRVRLGVEMFGLFLEYSNLFSRVEINKHNVIIKLLN